jgi:hypothetical protein
MHIIKEKDVPIFYSISGLSMFHTLSIIPLYGVMYVVLFKSFYIKDIVGINPFFIIAIITFIINYFYFKKAKYTILFKKFEQISNEQKKKKDILCIIYIVSIIIVHILFFIYFRAQNLK